LQTNFDIVLKKIIKTITFWERFKLSLPGRITIAKTFLLSQINHIGCFYSPDATRLDALQRVIDGFCTSKLRIARNRLYLDPAKGGIGLIKLEDFLCAQQVIWVKRAAQSTRDNWRVDLAISGAGNVLTPCPETLSNSGSVALLGITQSFLRFNTIFSKLDNNYRKAFIFNNPIFTRGQDDEGLLDAKFFFLGNIYNICFVKYSDCFHNNLFATMEYFHNELHLNLKFSVYFRFRNAIMYFNSKTKKSSEISVGLQDFLFSFKKGSKSVRRVLGSINQPSSLLENVTVTTFSRLIEVTLPAEETL